MSKPLTNISLLKTIITLLFLAPLFLSGSILSASVYEIGDDKPFQKLCQEGHYDRGLIILGDCNPADYILIENLEIRNANNKAVFSYRNTKQPYAKNAAGIFVWKGRDVRIRDCEIHSCGMGILTNHYPNTDLFYLGRSFI
jgi:hypothetical protein